jgi:pyridoxal phosphate enzyme (YggS family)
VDCRPSTVFKLGKLPRILRLVAVDELLPQEGARVAKSKSPLAEKLEEVRAKIAEAAVKAKREPADVTLVAVTKTAAPEQIRELMGLGVSDLGESRVQQLVQRASQLNEYHQRRVAYGDGGNVSPQLRWHMIGSLQRNKVKQLLPYAALIHSVDSLRLAEELDTQAGKLGKKAAVMLQVNASEEAQKHGVAVGAAVHLAEQMATMPNLQVVGLMTMAAFDADEAAVRQTFSRTREVFEELKYHKIGGAGMRHLSMGMSNDYELAIAEGATMVRVGTALFGGKPEQAAEDESD